MIYLYNTWIFYLSRWKREFSKPIWNQWAIPRLFSIIFFQKWISDPDDDKNIRKKWFLYLDLSWMAGLYQNLEILFQNFKFISGSKISIFEWSEFRILPIFLFICCLRVWLAGWRWWYVTKTLGKSIWEYCFLFTQILHQSVLWCPNFIYQRIIFTLISFLLEKLTKKKNNQQSCK